MIYINPIYNINRFELQGSGILLGECLTCEELDMCIVVYGTCPTCSVLKVWK